MDIYPVDVKYYASGDYINKTADRELRHMDPTIKLRRIVKSKVDYGRDRDLDVEGVNDYLLWYENFQDNQPQLPTLPRLVYFLLAQLYSDLSLDPSFKKKIGYLPSFRK